MRISIRNFPLAIDPSVDLIEAQSRTASEDSEMIADGSPGTWTVLHRVPTQLVMDLGEVPAEVRHCFGDHRALAHCRFLVCYAATGALTHLILIGDDGRIRVEDLPDEFMGRATELPSARLVFRDPTERDRFIDELPPRTLDALAEPPRRVGVSVVPNGNEG